VGPKASLDDLEEKKTLAPAGIRTTHSAPCSLITVPIPTPMAGSWTHLIQEYCYLLYYPDQQTYNIYINNILYNVRSPPRREGAG
jgi:hypothetical protein